MRSNLALVVGACLGTLVLAACNEPECTAAKPECPESKLCDVVQERCLPATPCELVVAETKAAYDAACIGKDAECTYCECRNKDEALKTTVDGTSVVFSCEARYQLEQAPIVQECVGAAATSAQDCLDQKQTCIVEPANEATKAACDATRK